jgi:hypothetical protein
MEDFVKLFSTDEGDVYHITLSEDDTLLSDEVKDCIRGTKLVGIDLRRLVGDNTTTLGLLAAIENTIADFFMDREDVMIFYYCDFLNPIPHTTKNAMPPQEYRSRLFENLFKRYIKLHSVRNVNLSVITVNGIGETYYFHLIYKDIHSKFASIISQDIKDGLSK